MKWPESLNTPRRDNCDRGRRAGVPRRRGELRLSAAPSSQDLRRDGLAGSARQWKAPGRARGRTGPLAHSSPIRSSGARRGVMKYGGDCAPRRHGWSRRRPTCTSPAANCIQRSVGPRRRELSGDTRGLGLGCLTLPEVDLWGVSVRLAGAENNTSTQADFCLCPKAKPLTANPGSG